MILYSENCPLHKPNTLSKLKLEVASIKLLFCYEMFMRIIDYFFDKFLWAITDTDPYEAFEIKKRKSVNLIDFSKMDINLATSYDL